MKWQGRYGEAVSFDAELRSGANFVCSRRYGEAAEGTFDAELRSGANLRPSVAAELRSGCSRRWRHRRCAAKHTADPYAICRSGTKSLLRLKTDLRSAANFVRTHLARSANEDYLARSAKFANNILRKMVCPYL